MSYTPKTESMFIPVDIEAHTVKEIISQTDLYLVSVTSKTYVFEDKMTKY